MARRASWSATGNRRPAGGGPFDDDAEAWKTGPISTVHFEFSPVDAPEPTRHSSKPIIGPPGQAVLGRGSGSEENQVKPGKQPRSCGRFADPCGPGTYRILTRLGRRVTTESEQFSQRLADAVGPEEIRSVVIALSKPGYTSRASKHPGYPNLLDRLLKLARDAAPADRLVAIAVLARLRRQQNRPFDRRFEDRLGETMSPLDAEPRVLDDPKEREYLAQGLRLVSFDGLDDYLANFIVGEAQNRSDARDTATQVLLERSGDLDVVFRAITPHVRRQPLETQDPATSRLRRSVRVLEALRSALRQAEPRVSEATGSLYAGLLSAGFDPSAERSVSIEAANIALDLLLAWLRPNFSIALDPSAFEAVRVLRRQFAPARWPDETIGARRSVARLIREATTLLAQSGVTDDGLRKALAMVLEEDDAASMLRAIAREQAGLSNNVRYWLETGRAPSEHRGGGAVAESVLDTIDRDLAEAYRDSEAAIALVEGLSDGLGEAVALANPSLADGYGELVGAIARLTRRIEAVAAKREFRLAGDPGSIVDYAPSDHVADRPIAGARKVRLMSPMVVRRTGAGAPQVIAKGKVEEA